MKLLSQLQEQSRSLKYRELIDESGFSSSQIYEWKKGVRERKERERKGVDKAAATYAVGVIKSYPYLGGRKGQAYLVYHRLGFLAQHNYTQLKSMVKRLIVQETMRRNLLPKGEKYQHERTDRPGEIWAEDFTQVAVGGTTLYISLLMDVASRYYLGYEVARRPSVGLVSRPVEQALQQNNGMPPTRFLLSDNGKQYISETHEEQLSSSAIVHKLIPACRPEYNGSMECGVKEFKQVFYSQWAHSERGADKRKTILSSARESLAATALILNAELPRPCLQGVTADDVHKGQAEESRAGNRCFRQQEEARTDRVFIRGKELWDTVAEALAPRTMSADELMTTFFFFQPRPLRALARYHKQGGGLPSTPRLKGG